MKKERSHIINMFGTEWEHLGKDRKKFIIYTILFAIAGIITLMTPLLIGTIFNQVQEQITSQQELHKLIGMIFLLLAISIGFWTFHGMGRVLEQTTGFIVQRNYVNSKIEKVLDLPTKWHKDHHSGDTIERISKGSNTMAEFSRNTTFEIFYAILNIVGSITILLFFDIRAAVVAVIFSFFTIYIIYKIDQKLNQQYKQINEYNNKASAAIFDYISNIITVITLRLKKTVKKEINTRLMASYQIEKKNVILNELKWGFASIVIALMISMVLAWRAYSDYNGAGTIMVGTLYILYGYLDNVGRTFNRFASLYGRIVRHSSRIVNAYPIDQEYEKLKIETKSSLPENWKEIKLENVSFTHSDKKSIMHIDNVNLNIKRGQRIALIGSSGSGKSTMLTLLRGLDNPESGQVFIDNKHYPDGFNRIKNEVTLIPQDPEIFNNTIKYNITMDLPTAEKDFKKVIELAKFSPVIPRLPNGIETNVLEKGVSLSGGEKQRLALARGLLAAKDSPLLLMDEPTSSVDTLNEVKIYENIFREFKDKTIISALHRLHLLKYFDYIYIFDKGKIVSQGTLEEIKKTPLFKKIWRAYNSKE